MPLIIIIVVRYRTTNPLSRIINPLYKIISYLVRNNSGKVAKTPSEPGREVEVAGAKHNDGTGSRHR
jgi:hypothetical protein